MMICQNASKCSKENCEHKVLHNEKAQCSLPCLIPGGIRQSRCTQHKEESMIQKLEELADQTAKKDAGKLRYDLIEGSMLPNPDGKYPFKHLKPGALTLNDINLAIHQCEFIIGGHARFLEELAKVYEFGCTKYSERTWQTVPNGRTRYESAIFRHIKDYKDGDWVNLRDGGVLHIAQIAWNAIAVKWFITNEK